MSAYKRSAVALCLFVCIVVGCGDYFDYPEGEVAREGEMAVRDLVRRIAEREDYSGYIGSDHWESIRRNEGQFGVEADVDLLTICPPGGMYCEYRVGLREGGAFALVGVYLNPPHPPQIINISFCERP